MCGVEVVSLHSTNCAWASTNPHVWQKYFYTLCEPGVARHRPCDNAQPVGGQTSNDIGTPRMTVCPVCTKLSEAVAVREEARRIADEEYSRAEVAAYKENQLIYPPPSPQENERVRDRGTRRRETRRDPDERRHEEKGGKKDRDRDRDRRHEGRERNYS